MNTFNHHPQLSGNLKFDICSGIGMTADVAKLPSTSMIVVGLLLAAYGFYLLKKEKENKAV